MQLFPLQCDKAKGNYHYICELMNQDKGACAVKECVYLFEDFVYVDFVGFYASFGFPARLGAFRATL